MNDELTEVVRTFADQAAAALGERLVSVIVYGDAVDGTVDRRDTVSLLVVIEPLDPIALRGAAPVLAQSRRRWNLDPVFFSRAELASSLDVFPLELLQMQSAYSVVRGEDVLAGLRIEPEDLRVQLEEDLKTKRLWLRQRYVFEPSDAAPIILESFATLPPVLASMLRLREQRVPPSERAVVEAAAATFDLDRPLLDCLLDAAEHRRRVDRTTGDDWLARYFVLLDRLVAAVEG